MKSDPSLLTEIRRYGPFDTNACFQCGSCTIICDLANDSTTFPRKNIRYVLLGLKEPLKESLEPWLCHDCGDCSTTCPREAEPRESMMTMRRYLAAQYDWTGLSSRIFQSRIWEIGSLVFVGILVLLLIIFYHLSIVGMPFSDFTSTSMGLEHMFDTITYVTMAVFLIPLFFILSHAFRMSRFTMGRWRSVRIPFHLYITEFKTMIWHLLTQKQMGNCPEKVHKIRWIKHLLLASACFLMFLLLFFFLRWFQTDRLYPLHHPQRWLGYLATAIIIFVSVDILVSRIRKREVMHKFSESSDWTFPIMLLLTAISGIAVHIFRYSGLELATHYAYALHLILSIPMLIILIPFGKWSHMIYRPLAIYFQAVREKALRQGSPQEDLLSHGEQKAA